MLSICLPVLCVVFIMRVALARLLDLNLITTRRFIINFRHFSEEGHHGFMEDIRIKIVDGLVGKVG